jgi:hypothetical protein
MTAALAKSWREVSAARIPAIHLAALAPLRDRPHIRIYLAGEAVWIRWSGDNADIVRCLMPIPSAEFFIANPPRWQQFGSLLPSNIEPLSGPGISLAAALVPQPIVPIEPDGLTFSPVTLTIVRCAEYRPTSALLCALADLKTWADEATTAELNAVRAARCNGKVILLGKSLPSIANAERYWGDGAFVPIGFRAEPDLDSASLRAALGVRDEELVFLSEDSAAIVPRNAFEPLSRAGIRLALHAAER